MLIAIFWVLQHYAGVLRRYVYGPSIKDVCSQDSSHADFRTFWCKKTLDFSKFMVYPHGQDGRGVEPVRTFCGQGREGGQFFAFLCGRPLWTAPYLILAPCSHLHDRAGQYKPWRTDCTLVSMSDNNKNKR